MKLPVIKITRRRSPISIYGFFTPFRAKKDGSSYLRDETRSWLGFNGFMIQTEKWKVMCIFRRHGAWSSIQRGTFK